MMQASREEDGRLPAPLRRLFGLAGSSRVLLLIVVAYLILVYLGWLKNPILAGLAVCALILAGLVARLRLTSGSLIGPLFFYELLRLARRGRTTLLRCAYGLVLLGLLCYLYTFRFPNRDLLTGAFADDWNVPINEMAGFSRHFVIGLLIVQSIALYVLTPLYLAGAIAEERERRTLELLLTTHLSAREIILGKLLARLVHLVLLLLMGVPILCLTSLMGGVHYLLLATGFLATLVNLFMVGCLSICVSTLARTALSAIAGTYVILLAFSCVIFCIGSPASFVLVLEEALQQHSAASSVGVLEFALLHLGVYTTVQLVIAGFCLYAAISQLRHGAELPLLVQSIPPPHGPIHVVLGATEQPVFIPIIAPPEPVRAPVLPARPRPLRMLPHPALLDAQPLVWKEAYREKGDMEQYFGCLAITLFLYCLALLLAFAFSLPRAYGVNEQQALSWALRVLLELVAAAWCCLTGVRTVAHLSRERQQRTLQELFTLPLSRLAILRAFWVGSILRFRYLGYFAGACLLLGLVSGALHPLSVLLLSLSLAVAVSLLASFGVWLGLAARTSLLAHAGMGLGLLVFFGGAWLAVFSQNGPGVLEQEPTAWDAHLFEVGLNPLAAWWQAGFSWTDLQQALLREDSLFLAHLQAILAGTGVLAVGACVFWSAAVYRLRALFR